MLILVLDFFTYYILYPMYPPVMWNIIEGTNKFVNNGASLMQEISTLRLRRSLSQYLNSDVGIVSHMLFYCAGIIIRSVTSFTIKAYY